MAEVTSPTEACAFPASVHSKPCSRRQAINLGGPVRLTRSLSKLKSEKLCMHASQCLWTVILTRTICGAQIAGSDICFWVEVARMNVDIRKPHLNISLRTVLIGLCRNTESSLPFLKVKASNILKI